MHRMRGPFWFPGNENALLNAALVLSVECCTVVDRTLIVVSGVNRRLLLFTLLLIQHFNNVHALTNVNTTLL